MTRGRDAVRTGTRYPYPTIVTLGRSGSGWDESKSDQLGYWPGSYSRTSTPHTSSTLPGLSEEVPTLRAQITPSPTGSIGVVSGSSVLGPDPRFTTAVNGTQGRERSFLGPDTKNVDVVPPTFRRTPFPQRYLCGVPTTPTSRSVPRVGTHCDNR